MDPIVLGWLVLAAWGAHAFARTLGATAGPAAMGAISFALSGWVLSAGDNLVFLAGAASLAWMAAAARLAGEGRPWGVAALGLATAGAALAGDAQALAVGLVASVLLAADARGGRGLGRALAGVALGLALGGVQLVPEWVHLWRTARGDASAFADRERWAFSPWRLVELASPGFFARFDLPGAAVYRAFAGRGDRTLPFAHSVHVGAPVLALAVLGVRRRGGPALAALAVASLWLALGHHAGADWLAGNIPIWARFRYSEKLIGPFTLFVSALAALGAERVVTEEPSRRLRRALAIAAALAVVLVLALAAFPGGVETALGAAAARAGAVPGEETAATVAVARARLLEGAALAAAGVAALAGLLWLRARRGARTWSLAGCALVWTMSSLALPFAVHFGEPIDPGPGLRAVAGSEAVPRIVAPLEPDVVTVDDLFEESLRLDAQVGRPAYSLLAGVESVDAYTGFAPRRLTRLQDAFGGSFWRLARRYAATHAVLPPPAESGSPVLASIVTARARLAFTDPVTGIAVWSLPHREWASFAASLDVVATPDEAIEEVKRLSSAGDRGAVVEARGQSFATAEGRVLAFERRPEAVRIEASSAGDAFLVVNDAWWEGWSARIDGAPTPIFAVDALVRGVRWPAGRHVLTMEYRPPEVRAGIAVSVAGVLGLCLVVALGLRRRNAPRPPDAPPP
jgi:hypothetical protein